MINILAALPSEGGAAGGSGGIPLAPKGGFTGFGPLGLAGGQDAVAVFTKFLSSVIGLMTVVAILWFIFLFLAGAIGLMTAGNDKGAVEGARSKITTGVIGLIVVISAIFIVDLIGNLIGIPTILDPAAWVKSLNIGG